MVIGLLTIAGIPTTIGVAQGISRRDEANKAEKEQAQQQMRKFCLECYCENPTGGATSLSGGRVVLKDGKMYIEPRDHSPSAKGHGFEGFYIEYADNERPKPLPLGMVSTIDSVPPTLNWIYVDKATREVRHGNRSQSKEHIVGSWSWEAGEEGGPGGVTLESEEGAVAVKTEEGWQVFWEDEEGKIGMKAKGKVTISLERKMIDPPPSPPPQHKEKTKVTTSEPQQETKVETKTELTRSKFKDEVRVSEPGQQAEVVKLSAGNGAKKAVSKKEPKLEISSSTTAKPMKRT